MFGHFHTSKHRSRNNFIFFCDKFWWNFDNFAISHNAELCQNANQTLCLAKIHSRLSVSRRRNHFGADFLKNSSHKLLPNNLLKNCAKSQKFWVYLCFTKRTIAVFYAYDQNFADIFILRLTSKSLRVPIRHSGCYIHCQHAP